MIAPSTRPAPMAMKNARKPSQNESVRFPVRTAAFTDGVFAIAATLLILEINVDTSHTSDLGSALLHLWPSYLAYVTSFITIGIIWMNHHTCVETIVKVDRV